LDPVVVGWPPDALDVGGWPGELDEVVATPIPMPTPARTTTPTITPTTGALIGDPDAAAVPAGVVDGAPT